MPYNCEKCRDLRIILTDAQPAPVPCPQCGDQRAPIRRAESALIKTLGIIPIPFRPWTLQDFIDLNEADMRGKSLAISAALDWTEDPQRGLWCVCGPSGVGKTTLALAALHVINVDRAVLAADARSLFNAIIEGYKLDTAQARLRAIETAPALLLDDLGRLGHGVSTDHTATVLHSILSVRANYQMPTLITTNLNPKQFAEQFDQTAASRIRRWAFTGRDGFITMRGEFVS